MIRPFNLAKIKLARRQGSPEAFQPPGARGDPYRKRKPGDGQGNSLNMPGDEGLAGEPPESTGYGLKERKGYPTGVSSFGDNEESPGKIPSDTDPDSPFGSDADKSDNTQYGTGTSTDFGLGLSDNEDRGDGQSRSTFEGSLGRYETTLRKIDGTDPNQPTIFNMSKRRPVFERVRNTQMD